MNAVEISGGCAEDMPALLGLIKELAVYEKAADEVDNAEAQLLEDWQQHRSFDFLMARFEGAAVGMALFYPRYSTWKGRCYYLEDLYVQPRFRGMGIGLALLEATAEKARDAGASRLDWQVLDWNTPAVDFYRKIGAFIEKEWWNCKWELTHADSESR